MEIGRIKLGEITPKRIVEALQRRIDNRRHQKAWDAAGGRAAANRQVLEELHNRHAGERCYVLANGPSLKKTDLSPLADSATIGMNRIYLLFEELPFTPTWFICLNELVLEQFADDILDLSLPRFVNWDVRHLFEKDSDVLFVKPSLGLQDTFQTDIRQPISSGGTVTFAALQLAYHLGYSEVVLLGLDHSFADKGTPNKTEVRTSETDANHFHPNYFPKGVKWQLPDLRRSELAYAVARDAFAADGRRILDATPGGRCDVFEKVAYEDVLKG